MAESADQNLTSIRFIYSHSLIWDNDDAVASILETGQPILADSIQGLTLLYVKGCSTIALLKTPLSDPVDISLISKLTKSGDAKEVSLLPAVIMGRMFRANHTPHVLLINQDTVRVFSVSRDLEHSLVSELAIAGIQECRMLNIFDALRDHILLGIVLTDSDIFLLTLTSGKLVKHRAVFPETAAQTVKFLLASLHISICLRGTISDKLIVSVLAVFAEDDREKGLISCEIQCDSIGPTTTDQTNTVSMDISMLPFDSALQTLLDAEKCLHTVSLAHLPRWFCAIAFSRDYDSPLYTEQDPFGAVAIIDIVSGNTAFVHEIKQESSTSNITSVDLNQLSVFPLALSPDSPFGHLLIQGSEGFVAMDYVVAPEGFSNSDIDLGSEMFHNCGNRLFFVAREDAGTKDSTPSGNVAFLSILNGYTMDLPAKNDMISPLLSTDADLFIPDNMSLQYATGPDTHVTLQQLRFYCYKELASDDEELLQREKCFRITEALIHAYKAWVPCMGTNQICLFHLADRNMLVASVLRVQDLLAKMFPSRTSISASFMSNRVLETLPSLEYTLAPTPPQATSDPSAALKTVPDPGELNAVKGSSPVDESNVSSLNAGASLSEKPTTEFAPATIEDTGTTDTAASAAATKLATDLIAKLKQDSVLDITRLKGDISRSQFLRFSTDRYAAFPQRLTKYFEVDNPADEARFRIMDLTQAARILLCCLDADSADETTTASAADSVFNALTSLYRYDFARLSYSDGMKDMQRAFRTVFINHQVLVDERSVLSLEKLRQLQVLLNDVRSKVSVVCSKLFTQCAPSPLLKPKHSSSSVPDFINQEDEELAEIRAGCSLLALAGKSSLFDVSFVHSATEKFRGLASEDIPSFNEYSNTADRNLRRMPTVYHIRVHDPLTSIGLSVYEILQALVPAKVLLAHKTFPRTVIICNDTSLLVAIASFLHDHSIQVSIQSASSTTSPSSTKSPANPDDFAVELDAFAKGKTSLLVSEFPTPSQMLSLRSMREFSSLIFVCPGNTISLKPEDAAHTITNILAALHPQKHIFFVSGGFQDDIIYGQTAFGSRDVARTVAISDLPANLQFLDKSADFSTAVYKNAPDAHLANATYRHKGRLSKPVLSSQMVEGTDSLSASSLLTGPTNYVVANKDLRKCINLSRSLACVGLSADLLHTEEKIDHAPEQAQRSSSILESDSLDLFEDFLRPPPNGADTSLDQLLSQITAGSMPDDSSKWRSMYLSNAQTRPTDSSSGIFYEGSQNADFANSSQHLSEYINGIHYDRAVHTKVLDADEQIGRRIWAENIPSDYLETELLYLSELRSVEEVSAPTVPKKPFAQFPSSQPQTQSQAQSQAKSQAPPAPVVKDRVPEITLPGGKQETKPVPSLQPLSLFGVQEASQKPFTAPTETNKEPPRSFSFAFPGTKADALKTCTTAPDLLSITNPFEKKDKLINSITSVAPSLSTAGDSKKVSKQPEAGGEIETVSKDTPNDSVTKEKEKTSDLTTAIGKAVFGLRAPSIDQDKNVNKPPENAPAKPLFSFGQPSTSDKPTATGKSTIQLGFTFGGSTSGEPAQQAASQPIKEATMNSVFGAVKPATQESAEKSNPNTAFGFTPPVVASNPTGTNPLAAPSAPQNSGGMFGFGSFGAQPQAQATNASTFSGFNIQAQSISTPANPAQSTPFATNPQNMFTGFGSNMFGQSSAFGSAKQ